MRRISTMLSAVAIVSLVAIGGITALGLLHAKAVGPVTQTFDCRWDEDGYQSVIVYRDRDGREIGQSAGAGDCTP